MAEETCAELRKSGAEIARVICKAAEKKRITPSDTYYSVAHDVAVGLQLINGYLGSLPPYWIEPDVEELSYSLLQDLLHITTVRGQPRPPGFYLERKEAAPPIHRKPLC